MAAIPTILKGDTPAAISITVAAGFDYSGATLHVLYKGVEKTFSPVTAGATLSLQYTAAETATFALGARPVTMFLSYADGRRRSIPADDVRIKVTDSPGEVYNAVISLRPSNLPDDATAGDSLGELKAKFNALKAAIGAACLLACMALEASSVTSNILNNVSGTNYVVTSVDLSGITVAETDPHAAGIVSGIVTKSYVENLGITAGTGGGGAVASVNGQTGTVVLAASDVGALPTSGGTLTGDIKIYKSGGIGGTISAGEAWGKVEAGANSVLGQLHVGGEDVSRGGKLVLQKGSKIEGGSTVEEPAEMWVNGTNVMDSISAVSSTVSQWSTYWDGDDVRVTITNYYGSSSLPSMYLEQKVADGGTNYFRTVWNELTRWNQFIGPGWNWMSSSWIGFNAWRTNITAQLDQKADRAWGYYDSHAGGYAPDGYTWISSPRIAISGGMAYQRFGDSAHAVWVLESNGLVTETSGVATNGYFKISDDEGNEMFAIRKGDKRTVGATCGSITTTVGAGGITHVHCTYAVVSGDHPTISTTADLANPNWKDETSADSIANVTWTGSSGDWHAEVWGKTDLSSMFIRATYEVGGETMIENAAPVKMNYIYLGGTKYSLGTASISGHTVLTLTPAP